MAKKLPATITIISFPTTIKLTNSTANTTFNNYNNNMQNNTNNYFKSNTN